MGMVEGMVEWTVFEIFRNRETLQLRKNLYARPNGHNHRNEGNLQEMEFESMG